MERHWNGAMKLYNIRLIFFREVRDQLRDRRTVFTIAVLPILLYPLLGMSFLQVAQFTKKHHAKVSVIGAEELPADPPLLVSKSNGKSWSFAEDACVSPEEASLLEIFPTALSPGDAGDEKQLRQNARDAISRGECDVVLYFPPGFGEQVQRLRAHAAERVPDSAEQPAAPEVPEPQIFFDAAKDRSRIAHDRVFAALWAWRSQFVREQLDKARVPVTTTEPFVLAPKDVAMESQRRAALWSRILPFVVLVWALTGAFYPAVDLCAGEKERGTLETLLSSPAMRGEVVWGKLLAIMTFSIATALLNLVSMCVTGALLMGHLQQLGATPGGIQLGPPPVAAMGWLVLGLIPIAALFSALALAIAALARSTKEGQYYLLPLLLINMPLMVLPMLPAAELDLGSSLIPVTGMLLLLRNLMEGHFGTALLYAVPVLAVTFGCCLLAIRWAVSQFNNESVLFRESERWGLGLWVRHLLRDRQETPSAAMAVLCGVVLLVILFFANFVVAVPGSWHQFANALFVRQVALIATPVLLMALMLTSRPRKALALNVPRWSAVPAAMVLAVVMHPVAMILVHTVTSIYPLSPETQQLMGPLQAMVGRAPLWSVLLVMALAPAVCEELAFRGFILTGLRHTGHKWGAILLSSIFFGVAHGMLQQSLNAAALGMVLGFIAVQAGSIVPCITFHFLYNSLTLLTARVTPELLETHPALGLLFQRADDVCIYNPVIVAIGGAATILVLLWFRQLPHRLTEEESLQRALTRQSLHAGT
jgi:sodium transport system permease protein